MSAQERLLDRLLPQGDAEETHRVVVRAESEGVLSALRALDLRKLPLTAVLLTLRGLPALVSKRDRSRLREAVTLASLEASGFGTVGEIPGREWVLGVHGRFWRPTGNVDPFDVDAFAGPVPAGRARALWSFRVEPAGAGRSELTTVTRIRCGDPGSRRRFRLYWLLVRPGSGLIRHEMLRAVRRAAERARSSPSNRTEEDPR